MKIIVVGLGYVGLSNAVLLAQHNEVIGVDISQERVSAINNRISPVDDPELSGYLKNRTLNLRASTDLRDVLNNADFVIISTPTNYDGNKNIFDTSTVKNVISEVLETNPNVCIVIKSTVPVGFTEEMKSYFSTNNIMFSPEFLREGSALHDSLYPSRIIIGERSKRAETFADLLAHGALKSDLRFSFTHSREAEAIKLFSNAYLAMRVAFFNELDNYALVEGLDTRAIIKGVCDDERIGNQYNNPSFGYGGYCLPKDTKQLLANYTNTPQKIIEAIVHSNTTRMDFLAEMILKKRPQVVGVYRLLMKSTGDNFRESSVLGIIERLKRQKIEVVIFEPIIDEAVAFDCPVEKDLSNFKQGCDIILSNRFSTDLDDVRDKIFTRDLFNNN